MQRQRTSLAWNRTALAELALLGAVVKVAADQADPRTITCAAIVLAQTLVVAGCVLARGNPTTSVPARWLVAVVAVSTTVACLAAVVLLAPSW